MRKWWLKDEEGHQRREGNVGKIKGKKNGKQRQDIEIKKLKIKGVKIRKKKR